MTPRDRLRTQAKQLAKTLEVLARQMETLEKLEREMNEDDRDYLTTEINFYLYDEGDIDAAAQCALDYTTNGYI